MFPHTGTRFGSDTSRFMGAGTSGHLWGGMEVREVGGRPAVRASSRTRQEHVATLGQGPRPPPLPQTPGPFALLREGLAPATTCPKRSRKGPLSGAKGGG